MLVPEVPSRLRRHDQAYACFLPPGLLYLASGVSSLIAADSGTAGGIGLLVQAPFAIVVLLTGVLGIVLSAPFWRRDYALMLLAGTTAMMLVQLFAEWGPVPVQSALGLAYGVLVVGLELAWLLRRRQITR